MKLIPNAARRHFDRVLTPIADGLIATGIHPNTLTTIGFLILVGSATAFGLGFIHLGGALLLFSGAFDMLDGKVARGGNRISRFGAFYDSTLDRVGELALFGAIAMFFLRGGVRVDLQGWAVGSAIVALGMGLIVSYARARAEGLMLECKVGIAQRAERIVVLGAPTVFLGAGPDGLLLFWLIALLAIVSAITVVQRIHHVYRVTQALAEERTVREPVPALVDAEEGRRRE